MSPRAALQVIFIWKVTRGTDDCLANTLYRYYHSALHCHYGSVPLFVPAGFGRTCNNFFLKPVHFLFVGGFDFEVRHNISRNTRHCIICFFFLCKHSAPKLAYPRPAAVLPCMAYTETCSALGCCTFDRFAFRITTLTLCSYLPLPFTFEEELPSAASWPRRARRCEGFGYLYMVCIIVYTHIIQSDGKRGILPQSLKYTGFRRPFFERPVCDFGIPSTYTYRHFRSMGCVLG